MHYSFHSTPTTTFKGRSEIVTKANQSSAVPGPSHYNVKKPLHQSATISQTKETRNLYKTFQPNPGPGTYASPSYITDGPKRAMSARYIDYTKRTPGPTDYDNDTLKVRAKSPGYTASTKSKSMRQIVFDMNSYKPGPTSYQGKGSFDKKNGIFMGASQRKDLTQTERTPAPNYYTKQTSADYTLNKHPTCKIGNESRKSEFNKGENTPGPAFYQKIGFVDENSKNKKGYSCRQKTPNLIVMQLSTFPAPGMYQSHLKNKHRAPRCSSSTAKRKTFMDDMQNFTKTLPGPGTHEMSFAGTKYRSMSASAFGRSVRKPLDDHEKTPGPPDYKNDKINLMNTAPRFSTTKTVGKNEFLQVNPENPGPGQYDPSVVLVKPNSSIYEVPKQQQRPDYEQHRKTPGPGFYNLRGKQSGPNWKFTAQKRISFTDLKNDAKDGRHYEVPSMIANPPGYMKVQSKIQYSPSKSLVQTSSSRF